MINQLSTDIQSYLNEIAERLWTGHASIMVGAGMSKNAINTINIFKNAPNWGELGDILYEKLYQSTPGDNVKYLSLLKLAEEFEAAFGRSTLEHLIAKSIADDEYEPSDIHKMLMELPWTDVFTTNYDTLLERSCKDIVARKYDVIINQNDLIYSNKPRIVKLHGSLPSERPFIITEEDYRMYPKKNAPFINTVQQSLLENTLCLIGFSGEDPNFLQWIGWINDNFGKSNAPKVYLIGVLNLSESQKKLLSNKNIISVDLSKCQGVDSNHRKGLEFFLNYLSSQKINRENLEWPLASHLITLDSLRETSNLPSLIEEWRVCREAYPNWLIVPRDRRDILWIYTVNHIFNEGIYKNLLPFQELDYIFELNWRLEKCLFPIWNKIASFFQKIIDKYNFFPEEIIEQREININNYYSQNSNWETYKSYWVHISISLLRFYREESFNEKWNETYQIVYKIRKHLTSDQISQFQYEQILNYISKLKYNEAKNILENWTQNNISSFWNAKRALLLAEFGHKKEALNLLESSLIEIRKKLNLYPIESDYALVSQEAILMFVIKIIQDNANKLKLGIMENNNYKNDNFKERWNELLLFKCDPWGEKEHFDLLLSQSYNIKTLQTEKNEFEIGRTTRSYSMEQIDKDLFISYNFLRYLEELAIPLSLAIPIFDINTINGMLKRIKLVSPKWGMSILSRINFIKSVKVIFDRRQLVEFPVNVINEYIIEYLGLYKIIANDRKSNDINNAFMEKIPFILSRLCTKCSESLKMDMFVVYKEIYISKNKLPEVNRFIYNLIDSSQPETIKSAIELLIDLPIIDSSLYYQFEDPFAYFRHTRIEERLKIDQKVLDTIYDIAGENSNTRHNAVLRLIFLYTIDQLNEDQVHKLFVVLWKYTDSNSKFPASQPFPYYTFLKWDQPDNVNVRHLFKEYILKNTFSIQELNSSSGISMNRGVDSYANNLLHGSKTFYNINGIVWSTDELECILSKCEQWWELDKHYLAEDKYKMDSFAGSIHEEFFLRFIVLSNIISQVFGCIKNQLNSYLLDHIKLLTVDMEKYSIPTIKIKIIFGFYEKFNDYLVELVKLIRSNNRSSLLIALESISYAIEFSSFKEDNYFKNELIKHISIPLQWNVSDLIVDIYDVLRTLISNTDIDLSSISDIIYSSLSSVLSVDVINSNISVEDYLLLKRKAISLASVIYNNCIKLGTNIPQVVMSWKELSSDENEFGDIRNRWIQSL